ncbi:MAG: LemA family protein [Deltaproteobacteria bacterium]|nr:LemA family protein [Deltaproteobacteria bacterium]
MKRGLIMTLAVIVGIVVLCAAVFGGTYNRLVAGEETVSSAWSQVENVYQRRADLIPNLVETVKGYAAHERETLQGVVEARSKVSQMKLGADVVNNPQTLTQFQAMQGELSSALSRLMVVVERYPDLKANQNFLTLQSQLEGTENRIAVERRRFNEAAQAFNTIRRTFPNVIIANVMGFEKKAYFEAAAGAEQAPTVEFE